MTARARGLTELVIAALLFGLMAYVAKLATHSFDGAQVALVRFAVGCAVALGYHGGLRRPPRVVRWDLLFFRGLFGGLAVLFYFLAIGHLPVGTATLLNYSAPIFSSTFAALFLGEVVSGVTLVALVLASTGVVLVVYGQGRELGGGWLWLAIGVASAVVSGAAITTIRAARRTDGAWEVFLAFCIVGALTSGPFALHAWKSPTWEMWMLLVVVGTVAAVAQLLMTQGLGTVEAATAGIISQLTVVTALLLGHFLDGEPFAGVSLVGATLTVAGVSLVSGASRMRAAIAR